MFLIVHCFFYLSNLLGACKFWGDSSVCTLGTELLEVISTAISESMVQTEVNDA